MSDTDFKRMTINEIDARPYVTDHQFAELPGAVQMYIKAQAEIGGHWECDVFNARWRNQLVAMPTEVSLGEVASWYGMVATTASITRTVTDRRALPTLSSLQRLGLGLCQGPWLTTEAPSKQTWGVYADPYY